MAAMSVMIKKSEEREVLYSYISDVHKDVYGYRPHHLNVQAMSIEALNKMADDLAVALEVSIANQKTEEQEAADRFEAMIKKNMDEFGIDRETAIRWDIQALDIAEDVAHHGMWWYALEHSLNYHYFDSKEAK